MQAAKPDEFSSHFAELRRRVLAQQALRTGLIGGACGLLADCGWLVAAWYLREPAWRAPWILGCAPSFGCLLGVLFAARRQFSSTELALFLDARLASHEAIVTALEIPQTNEVALAVRARATQTLASADRSRLRLPLFARVQLVALPALALGAWLYQLPARALPPQPRAPGAERIQRAAVRGLDRIEALSAAPSLSAQDRERLRQLAAEARRLRADLANGLERREAQARLSALRDGVRDARDPANDPGEHAGTEAALSVLGHEPSTERAARALGNGDLVGFDDEMARAANAAEQSAREAARRALSDAAKQARERGARQTAERLERALEAFDQRAEQSEALRELARALQGKLAPGAQSAFDEFLRKGDPAAAKRLADALSQALSGLSEQERAQLIEALKRRQERSGANGSAASREATRELLKQLETEAGRKQLERALREFAQSASADAERQRALEGAERGGAEAERELGPALPLPGGGSAQPPGGGNGRSERGGVNSGSSAPGATPHPASSAARPNGGELRAHANTRVLPGTPLAAHGFGRTEGRSGDTANRAGTGELSSRAAAEIGAVDRADVPQEYREHVERYFEP